MGKRRRVLYQSFHKILCVGEGDFSFALSLARKFGMATNIVATSRDSRVFLEEMYESASRNLTELESLGCTLVHKVNVHTMMHHPLLIKFKDFDRIVFNYPHAGFIGRREFEYRQIKRHRKLVRGFLRNASYMLGEKGQIHITHREDYPYSEWKIVELAECEELILVGEVFFNPLRYPGYINKKGDGPHCDHTFPIGESYTFIFAMAST
ncbi:PREDICTED: uncharacterized protein At4g26485-like [Lupinus angustifolius]|uniref:uncharacterized protein At4g26485-like n=1 Tax=Lupinus angustifolius TaxID=3871 RepID=UPI00092FC8E2|nr:PREDICTED: uncharacterized protein At4g26485-like [Lupinus angustifolius]